MPEVEINEGWEQRYEAIKEHVHVRIQADEITSDLVFVGLISPEERMRSNWKIWLIEPFLTRMVVNMLKGTVKYTKDDWSAETWQDMGMDDKADGINYELLFHDYLRKLGVLE